MVDARKGSRPIITNVHQDYSQTLQDLIDEAATAWHSGEAPSRILLPNGFIPLSSTIRLRDGIELKGQGSILNNGTRFLWQGDPEVPVFESNPDNYLSTCRVEDIGIQPDTAHGVPPPTGQGHGFVLHAPVNTCAFRRISIARLTGNAIDIRRQSHYPDDRTGAGNCIFEQIFAITNGGFGVRAEGYHQVHFLMPDFNGNRLGDFHFLNGSGNQSAILISNLWAESGGQSPSADQRILLEHLDGGQVTLVSPQFSGPIGLETIIRVIGPSGASVNLIGASQFGSSNWVIDSVNNLTISASDRINLIGEELVARDIRVRRSISVASSEAATTAQNIVRKLEIFDGNGASLGFVPIYDQID